MRYISSLGFPLKPPDFRIKVDGDQRDFFQKIARQLRRSICCSEWDQCKWGY